MLWIVVSLLAVPIGIRFIFGVFYPTFAGHGLSWASIQIGVQSVGRAIWFSWDLLLIVWIRLIVELVVVAGVVCTGAWLRRRAAGLAAVVIALGPAFIAVRGVQQVFVQLLSWSLVIGKMNEDARLVWLIEAVGLIGVPLCASLAARILRSESMAGTFLVFVCSGAFEYWL